MGKLTEGQRRMLERIGRTPVRFAEQDGTQGRTLAGLEKRGLVEEKVTDFYGEQLKAFVLTDAGRAALEAK